jgi:purine-binding chemotaxis protein CheW
LADLALLCRVHRAVCALPLSEVVETLRPLPIEPIAGAPAFVRGLSVLRGAAVPVVDLGLVLGMGGVEATRFVSLRIGSRSVALAVEAVIGIRPLERQILSALPPLLGAGDGPALQALGRLDRELLLVLDSARLLPDAGLLEGGFPAAPPSPAHPKAQPS